MKYFLILATKVDHKHAFKIVKVAQQDSAAFLKRNLEEVVCESDSMKDLLFKFGEKLDRGMRF